MRPTDTRTFFDDDAETFDDPPLLVDFDEVPGVTAPDARPRKPKAAPGPFEIGVVYRKGTRFFLAVSDRMLVSMKDGEVLEIRPTSRYDVVRSISVLELCNTWGITLEQLDATVMRYLAPSQERVKPRPRGARRQRALDELRWRAKRTVRLMAG